VVTFCEEKDNPLHTDLPSHFRESPISLSL
jgi:hypothetical protein